MDIGGTHVPDLKITGESPRFKVWLGGVEIPVRKLALALDAGRMPEVTIEMFVGTVEVEGACLVDLLANSMDTKVEIAATE